MDFERWQGALVELLQDAVESGASVGFLPPLDAGEAQRYWWSVGVAMDDSGRLLLALWVAGELAEAVMVKRKFRGHGMGRALMHAVEQEARRMGVRLLVLDTRAGDVADGMYRKLGWEVCGVVPGYAKSADGAFHATVFFHKDLAGVPMGPMQGR